MKFADAFAKIRYDLEGNSNQTYSGKVVGVNTDENGKGYTIIQTPFGRKRVPRTPYDSVGSQRIRVQTDSGVADTPL